MTSQFSSMLWYCRLQWRRSLTPFGYWRITFQNDTPVHWTGVLLCVVNTVYKITKQTYTVYTVYIWLTSFS